MREDILGVSTPDEICTCVNTISSALNECQPFNDIEVEVNTDFLKTARREARKIVKMVESTIKIHKLNF
jgi:hypothetical protein